MSGKSQIDLNALIEWKKYFLFSIFIEIWLTYDIV